MTTEPSEPPPETPESVVQAVVDALEEGRLAEILPMIDPAELPRWRRRTLSMLRHAEAEPEGAAVLAEWGVALLPELEGLSDADLFERWLRAFSLEARMRIGFLPDHVPPPPRIRRTVLGGVREGDSLAHVLYREAAAGPGAQPGSVRIATLRRTGAGWRLGMDYDLLGYTAWHFGPAPSGAG